MQRKYEDIPQKHHQAEDDSCLVFAEPKLRYTPYYQGLFCLKHHQARQGICSGLVFDEVTEYNNGIQGQALMAHLRNSQRWKEHVYSFGSTTTKAGVSVVLGEGYVRETKLSGVESKVEEAASVEQVIESIKKQSDDFQKPVTFLCGIKMYKWLWPIAGHATRFDSLGDGQCSAYDPNVGRYVGECSAVSKKYQQILKAYNPGDAAIVSFPRKPGL